MKKKVFFIIIFFLLITQVYSAPIKVNDNSITEENITLEEINNINNGILKFQDQNTNKIIPEIKIRDLISNIKNGNFKFNIYSFLNNILKLLFSETYKNLHIFIKLLVLVALLAILKNLQSSFLSENIGELAFFVGYIVILSMLFISFNTSIGIVLNTIESLKGFMYVIMPILITLLTSSGNFIVSGFFESILFIMIGGIINVIKNMFIPLIFIATVFSVISNISDKIQLNNLAKFIKQISTVSLGIILTIFVAIVSIQGTLGASVDGITSKTAKFALGAFIPVVGKYLADAADSVIGCTLIIKNAAGVLGMIGIISVCLIPFIKILSLILIFKTTCALAEPLADKRIVTCISEISNSITLVLGSVAVLAFLFLLFITMVIVASNISIMYR